MDKIIYLDHAATTKCAPEAVQAMLPYFTEYYGNASTIYQLGAQSKKAIQNTRSKIAESLHADPSEIYFTAGGSESDNWALVATAEAYASKGKHIITSKIEHHAILHTCEYLEKRGFQITYVDVDANGIVKLDELEKAIRPDTILISIMFANNEIGTIQPIEEIGRIAKEKGILFHTDAVQGYGKFRIIPKNLNIDLLSVSAHKIHGPKGAGFLYIKEGTKIRPIIYGGGQQKGMRSGTENVPGIAGMALASNMCYANLNEDMERLYSLRDYFISEATKLTGVTLNGSEGRDCAPHIISLSIEGIRAEVLLHALEDKGIYVSSGSACASNRPSLSGTLTAMGVNRNLLDSTLRFSLSVHTTREELDYTLENLGTIIPMLRKYTRH